MRHGGTLSTPARTALSEGSGLGFRHPAGDCARPAADFPFLDGLSGVGVKRTVGRGQQGNGGKARFGGELPGAAGLSRSGKPPSRSSLVSLGSRCPSAVELVATARQADKPPNPRTYRGDPGPRVRTLNRTRRKGQFCRARTAPPCRRSIPRPAEPIRPA